MNTKTTPCVTNLTSRLRPLAVALLPACLLLAGCKPSEQSQQAAGKATIQVKGSDTMVNLAQSWAETYKTIAPDVNIEVSGGGSGVGIAALIRGTIDIADASRDMKASEIDQVKQNTGKDAKEFTVGYDALAIYVHKDNPLDEITFEQLASIYAEDGTITKWSQLGVQVPGCDSDDIVRVSRQSSSGTYEFFREHVLGNKDYKLGSTDLNGSKEVVELVTTTPCAIGYSGMGYATLDVKTLKVAQKKGDPAYAPTVENAMNKTYPIARSLHLYTVGEPQGAVQTYIDWIHSPAGQKIVADTGYVPLNQ